MRRRQMCSSDNLAGGVTCVGNYNPNSGIGQAASDNARLLSKRFPLEMVNGGPGKYKVHYHHGMPPDHPPSWARDKITSSFWMVETTAIHPLWEESANGFTEIWTGSTTSAAAIETLPSHSPVYVIPHYVPVPDLAPKLRGDKFVVMAAMAPPTSRKNPEGVIRAFQLAFEGVDDVELLFKFRTNEHTFKHLVKAITNNDKRIKFLFHEMNRNSLSKLYTESDVFLSLQRGGGFELHCAEAAAHGIPVVSTKVGGVLDYLDESFSYLIDGPVCEFDGEHLVNSGGTWTEPDIELAALALQAIYRYDQTRINQVFNDSRTAIQSKLSEEVVGRLLEERVNHLLTL